MRPMTARRTHKTMLALTDRLQGPAATQRRAKWGGRSGAAETERGKPSLPHASQAKASHTGLSRGSHLSPASHTCHMASPFPRPFPIALRICPRCLSSCNVYSPRKEEANKPGQPRLDRHSKEAAGCVDRPSPHTLMATLTLTCTRPSLLLLLLFPPPTCSCSWEANLNPIAYLRQCLRRVQCSVPASYVCVCVCACVAK